MPSRRVRLFERLVLDRTRPASYATKCPSSRVDKTSSQTVLQSVGSAEAASAEAYSIPLFFILLLADFHLAILRSMLLLLLLGNDLVRLLDRRIPRKSFLATFSFVSSSPYGLNWPACAAGSEPTSVRLWLRRMCAPGRLISSFRRTSLVANVLDSSSSTLSPLPPQMVVQSSLVSSIMYCMN